ncbi:MAG: caspase family protein, partial [Bacteroidota bacterium]
MRKNILFYFVIIIYSVTSSAQNSKCIKTLIGHAAEVNSVCFSPDGKYIASGSWDNTIKIWDIENGSMFTLSENNSVVRFVCFSPDGKKIASCTNHDIIKIWDVESRKFINTLEIHQPINSFCFSPDGKSIASNSDNLIQIWDLKSGKRLNKLSGFSSSIRTVCFLQDGKHLASCSDNNIVKIWDVNSEKCINTILLESSFQGSVCFSHDVKLLSSGTDYNTIKIWDIENGKCIKALMGRFSNQKFSGSVSFSKDSKHLASGTDYNTIKIWDIETGKVINTLTGYSPGFSINFSTDGKLLASGNSDNTIKVWSVEDVKPKPKLPAQIELSKLLFNDFEDINNNIIDGNEQSQISFQLKNTGKGSAYGIVVSLSTEQDVKGISYQKEYKIDELAPNEEKQIVLPITSDFNTENAKVKFIIKTKEANGFDAPDEIIHVESAKFLNPLVSVADYNFSSEKGGIAKLGEVIKLNFAVQNKGQGEAKNVKIVCTLPSSNVFAAGETEFTVPLLKPNESKVINFDFFPNRIYKQNNIPVAIDITESYGKYGESKTCTVALNTELKQQNEIIVQGTKQESIEIKSVSLLSDIDKNLPITNGNNTNAIAVIIGNSNYANTKSVAYAISDAQSIKNYLINVMGFKEGNILFKENATLGDFNTLFGTKENQKGRLANTIKENISDVFVFYAGHGAPGLKDNKGYFVPVECNP